MNDNDSYLLVVWMVTYNHENFIKESIESVLNQVCNFNFKIFISDDCSTDNTTKICREYEKLHPNKITLFVSEKNKGAAQNGVFLYEKSFQSNAEYIAILEGDDFWIDPHKLQKQVDFLKKNPDFVIHFMNTSVVDKNSCLVTSKLLNINRTIFSIDDFLMPDNPIATLTVMFRNIPELKSEKFKIILDYPYGDWGLWVYILYYSGLKAKFDDTTVASYRVHDGGVFSKKKSTETLRKIIRIQQLNLANFDKIDKQKIHLTITELKVKLLRELLHTSKNEAFLLYVSNFYKLSKIFKIRDFLYALRKY